MLVLDPNRRYTIPQIKQHRWMMCEPRDSVAFLSEKSNAFSRTAYVEPNEQVLRLMAGLGIDVQRTRNSLKVSGRSVVCGHWPSATICGRALFDICSDVKYFFRRRIATIIMRPFICCCWIVSALGRYRRTALSAVLPPQTIRAPIGHRTWTWRIRWVNRSDGGPVLLQSKPCGSWTLAPLGMDSTTIRMGSRCRIWRCAKMVTARWWCRHHVKLTVNHVRQFHRWWAPVPTVDCHRIGCCRSVWTNA